MASYLPTLAALLAIQVQTCVPSRRAPPEPHEPVRDPSGPDRDNGDEPVSAREALLSYVGTRGRDFQGRELHDVFITAPQLAEIVGYSEATARRRLNYFEEQGVVKSNHEANVRFWELTEDFSALEDDMIRDEEMVTETAQRLMELAEDA
nr:DeoR family transcriptional regulator [Halomicroarcula laminariae]